MFNKMITSA